MISHIGEESLWDDKQLETWILSLEDRLVEFLHCKTPSDPSPPLPGEYDCTNKMSTS